MIHVSIATRTVHITCPWIDQGSLEDSILLRVVLCEPTYASETQYTGGGPQHVHPPTRIQTQCMHSSVLVEIRMIMDIEEAHKHCVPLCHADEDECVEEQGPIITAALQYQSAPHVRPTLQDRARNTA